MRTKLLILVLCPLFLSPGDSTAAGLIYKLPEDGAWVRFDGQLTHEETAAAFSLTISSVGDATVDGEQCRWIETIEQFEVDGSKQPRRIVKALIPERFLKFGENPIEHVVRAWTQFGDADPVEVEDPGPQTPTIGMLLAAPLRNAKQLDREVVESKLGKLECEGVIGTVLYEQGEIKIVGTYELRLHETAPFGVVAGKIALSQTGGPAGRAPESGTMSFKLADFGQDAKSHLRNQK